MFIYNPTPDYKSNKNYLQKIKAHEFIVLLSFCPFIVHEKSCCTDPVKKPTLSKSYKVTQEPSLASTFPIFTAWLEKRKKLYAKEFLITTWLHFFTLKGDAQYPLNMFRKKIRLF